MKLVELIRKRDSGHRAVATATSATTATEKPELRPTVAIVATVAVANPLGANSDLVPILPSVSGLSGPDREVSVKTISSQPDAEPTPPLQPGWRVVYRDSQWKLAGGSDDPDHGTVKACRWIAGAWTVQITDGQEIPLSRIRSVAAMDYKGRLMGAWTVREHGYDGEGPVTRGGQN